eukprot:260249-Chlamydomonas_euryale.AAC.1
MQQTLIHKPINLQPPTAQHPTALTAPGQLGKNLQPPTAQHPTALIAQHPTTLMAPGQLGKTVPPV